MEKRRITLAFRAGALETFGQTFLYVVLTVLCIPAAWGAANLTGWWAGRTERSDGGRIAFDGRPAEVWGLFLAIVVLDFLPQIVRSMTRGDHRGTGMVLVVTLVLLPLIVAVKLPALRWIVTHLHLEPGGRARFTATYGGYLGWMFILFASYFTIIGWAWVLTAMVRWLCGHIRGQGWTMEFSGTGWSLLWHSGLWLLGCLPIVTIPWVLRAAYAWFTDHASLVEDDRPL